MATSTLQSKIVNNDAQKANTIEKRLVLSLFDTLYIAAQHSLIQSINALASEAIRLTLYVSQHGPARS